MRNLSANLSPRAAASLLPPSLLSLRSLRLSLLPPEHAMPLDYSKFDKVDEFEDERKELYKEELRKYKAADRERRFLESVQGSKKPLPGGRYIAVKVTCGEVTLKLSFKPEHLTKPFVTMLVKPFLKAYNKKRPNDPDLAEEDVTGLVISDETGTRDYRTKEAVDLRLNAKIGDILTDYKGSMHDSVRWSDYHDSYAPPQGMVWDTEHNVTLIVDGSASADDLDAGGLSLEDNSVGEKIVMPGLA